MRILISNDDGIDARGIHELANALRKGLDAEIYIFAPARQMSATGHGITMHETVHAQKREFEGAKMAYAVTGTPSDCVKLGVTIMENMGAIPDLVFAGINHGGNLGTDIHYSGTVSAAMEGSFCKIPSIAVSVNSHEAEHFEYACELAVEVVRLGYGKFDYRTVLNINTPNLPKSEIRGLLFTHIGDREYADEFDPVIDENGNISCEYQGVPVVYEGSVDVDVIADQERYASITPIHRDMTQYEMIDELSRWGFRGFAR